MPFPYRFWFHDPFGRTNSRGVCCLKHNCSGIESFLLTSISAMNTGLVLDSRVDRLPDRLLHSVITECINGKKLVALEGFSRFYWWYFISGMIMWKKKKEKNGKISKKREELETTGRCNACTGFHRYQRTLPKSLKIWFTYFYVSSSFLFLKSWYYKDIFYVATICWFPTSWKPVSLRLLT